MVMNSTFLSTSISKAGGQPRVHSWLPTEEGYATTDMESDQLHVPATSFYFPQWEEAQPKNLRVDIFGNSFRRFADLHVRFPQSALSYFILFPESV